MNGWLVALVVGVFLGSVVYLLAAPRERKPLAFLVHCMALLLAGLIP